MASVASTLAQRLSALQARDALCQTMGSRSVFLMRRSMSFKGGHRVTVDLAQAVSQQLLVRGLTQMS